MKFFSWIVSFFLILSSCSQSHIYRYYCPHNNNKDMNGFDDIIVISGKKPNRLLTDAYKDSRRVLYQSYDEDNRITTVYKHVYPNTYKILRLNLSSPPVFLYGSGYHSTHKKFEKSYGLPFSRKALALFNKNPELIKYLPQRPDDQEISFSFFKFKQNCHSMGIIEFYIRYVLLYIIKIMSV